MVEKRFQEIFTKWAKTHYKGGNVAWELKLEKGKSFAFNKVADHQIDGLQAVKHKGIYHKVSDTPVSVAGGGMRFTAKKPFDCFFLQGEAYVVICFYEPRKPKRTYFIDVDDFVYERDTADRKSLTEKRADEIAVHFYEL
jgi:penicillin-binding protein-related factor A (putative recombinase)